MAILPIILKLILTQRAFHLQSDLDKSVIITYWLFLLLNVFLVVSIAGMFVYLFIHLFIRSFIYLFFFFIYLFIYLFITFFVLTGSIWGVLDQIIANPSVVISLLGNSLPKQAIFFSNYIVTNATSKFVIWFLSFFCWIILPLLS
jgi:hypothetical protein